MEPRENQLEEALNLLESNGHEYAPQSCPVCQKVGKLMGRHYGCEVLRHRKYGNQPKLQGPEGEL